MRTHRIRNSYAGLSRVTLLACILAGCVTLALEIALWDWLMGWGGNTAPILETLPICDHMLLTASEREEARRSNVGTYEFDGMYYVNASLPAEYWTEWRSPYGHSTGSDIGSCS